MTGVALLRVGSQVRINPHSPKGVYVCENTQNTVRFGWAVTAVEHATGRPGLEQRDLILSGVPAVIFPIVLAIANATFCMCGSRLIIG